MQQAAASYGYLVITPNTAAEGYLVITRSTQFVLLPNPNPNPHPTQATLVVANRATADVKLRATCIWVKDGGRLLAGRPAVPTSFAPEVPAGHPTILPLPRCWQGTCAGLADKVGAACGAGTVCDAAAYKLALSQFRWSRPTSVTECPLTCCLQDPTKSGKAVGNCPASLDQYLGTGPFEGLLDIMMTGDDATVGYCGGGVTAKGHMGKFNSGRIVRVDGELSLHGKRPSNTWSWLRETAGSGASRLVVQGRQDWTVGDEVLVATTSDSEAQTEERTAAAWVPAAGACSAPPCFDTELTISAPLSHTHLAVTEAHNGHALSMRAEVAVLSRPTIIIRGVNSLFYNFRFHMMEKQEQGVFIKVNLAIMVT
eukprot:scaffold49914_cov33-Phaeocystis_antarctica.AAC.2